MSILNNNINTAKIFLWDNSFNTATYTAGGSIVNLLKGTVMGRISATGKIIPMASDASDGSADVVGILADDYTVAASATVNLTFCYGGDVAEELLVLTKVGDTLDTVVTGKGRIRDLIVRNTHCLLIKSTDLTKYNN